MGSSLGIQPSHSPFCLECPSDLYILNCLCCMYIYCHRNIGSSSTRAWPEKWWEGRKEVGAFSYRKAPTGSRSTGDLPPLYLLATLFTLSTFHLWFLRDHKVWLGQIYLCALCIVLVVLPSWVLPKGLRKRQLILFSSRSPRTCRYPLLAYPPVWLLDAYHEFFHDINESIFVEMLDVMCAVLLHDYILGGFPLCNLHCLRNSVNNVSSFTGKTWGTYITQLICPKRAPICVRQYLPSLGV